MKKMTAALLMMIALVLNAACAMAACEYTALSSASFGEDNGTAVKFVSGSYYLSENADSAGKLLVVPQGVTVDLCLHGKTLDVKRDGVGIEVKGTLNLHDCQGGGKLINNKRIVHVMDGGCFNMTGGTLMADTPNESIGIYFTGDAKGNITGGSIGEPDKVNVGDGGNLMNSVLAGGTSYVEIGGTARVYGGAAVACITIDEDGGQAGTQTDATVKISGQAKIISEFAGNQNQGSGAANLGNMIIDGDGVMIRGSIGVMQMAGKVEIVRGRIEGKAMAIMMINMSDPNAQIPIEDYEKLVAEGSEVKEGCLTTLKQGDATYVVVGKKQAENAAAASNAAADAGLPQTGDRSSLPLWTALLTLCAGAALWMKRARA